MPGNISQLPRIKDVKLDSSYISWLSEIKQRYRSAQIKAAVKVNIEKLSFNWSVGRDLVIRKAEEKWGSGIVEQLSFDLQYAFPHDKGFSSRNVWRMKQWYLFFSTPDARQKLPQVVAELQRRPGQLIANSQDDSITTDFPTVLGLVPWGHQTEIVSSMLWLNSK